MDSKEYFIGEQMAIGIYLWSKDLSQQTPTKQPVTGATPKVKIRQGSGDWAKELGVETMTEPDPTNHPGVYLLMLNTTKYNGDLNLRFYRDDALAFMVAEKRITLNGKKV